MSKFTLAIIVAISIAIIVVIWTIDTPWLNANGGFKNEITGFAGFVIVGCVVYSSVKASPRISPV